ncbi:MAG: glycosyltransferase [Clostridia bacterium]|nr:glycosyltransferase [Clostridia bacterium]
MDLISIIVPVYKVEKYLSECIDSILAQTYENFELVLVDDGSPDNSGKICDEYASRDKRIKVIHKGNAGVSSARNTGLDNANGDYITFIDSDDFVDKRYLEVLYNSLKQNDSDISICKFSAYKNGNYIASLEKFPKSITVDFLDNRFVNYLSQYFNFKKNIMGSCWRTLYKRELIGHYRLNQNLKICEDLLFLITLMCEAKKLSFSNEVLYFYRSNESSAIRSYKENYLENNIFLDKELIMLLSNKSKRIEKILKNYRGFLCYLVLTNEMLHKSGQEKKENIVRIKRNDFYKNFKLFKVLGILRIKSYPRFIVNWARIKFNLY